MNLIIKLLLGLFFSLIFASATAENLQYLVKPTGKYQVSAKHYQWINTNLCPDYFYQKPDEWFYKDTGKSNCHRVQVTIYYPTNSKSKNYLSYFTNNIQQVELDIKNKVITDKNLPTAQQYNSKQKLVKSYVLESGNIVNSEFPLIIFLPAFSANSYYYQNFITNLVSHGYMVAAVDSAYSQSLYDSKAHKFLPVAPIKFESGINSALQPHSNLDEVNSDYDFVLKQLHLYSLKDKLIQHIDFNKVGGLGHSLGARSIYNQAQSTQTQLKVAAVMEIGRDKTLLHNSGIHIPFLYINAAEMKVTDKQYFGQNASFELYKNNTLIMLTPSESNFDYSRHLTFSDNATLYYHNNKLLQLSAATYNDNNAEYNQWLGSANAYNLTAEVNEYLLNFFDYYLKHQSSSVFNKCEAISKEALIYCGTSTGNIITY